MELISHLQSSICLAEPPLIVHTGLAIHGRPSGRSQESYRLPDLWCVHLYRYEGELEIDGVRFPIRPGYASMVPADQGMVFRYSGPSEHCFCHFKPMPGLTTCQIPMMQDLGSSFSDLDRRFSQAATTISFSKERVQAMIWDLLWHLTDGSRELSESKTRKYHPAVRTALQIIEIRLAENLSVSELAVHSDVSYSYLSKLFQRDLGMKVAEYIRNRRGEKAAHLLKFSTLAIKSIAVAVGVPDLQMFNRLIHLLYGVSPRRLRAEHYRSKAIL